MSRMTKSFFSILNSNAFEILKLFGMPDEFNKKVLYREDYEKSAFMKPEVTEDELFTIFETKKAIFEKQTKDMLNKMLQDYVELKTIWSCYQKKQGQKSNRIYKEIFAQVDTKNLKKNGDSSNV